MWNNLISRWMEMATWWLPKGDNDSSAEPSREPSAAAEPAPETASTEAAAPAEPEAPTASDDLTAIRGIGPAMQKRLVAMGIRTHADLAAADAETLTERLKADKAVVSQAQIERWIESAGG